MKWLYFFITSLLLACAEPKYAQVISHNPEPGESFKVEADCSMRFQLFGQCLSWRFSDEIKAQNDLTMIIKIYRPNFYDQSLVYQDIPDGRFLNAKLWMPSMGHGSIPTQIKRLDVGTYAISRVNFIMSGHWQIYFDQVENNQIDRLTIDVDIP